MRAVAVPYIIALILGVAVIGLVGYWFASSGGKFGGQSAKTICDNKFLQYCITNPGKSFTDFVNAGNSECTGSGSYNNCNEVLGATGRLAPEPQPPQTGQPGVICQGGVTLCKKTNNCQDCGAGWQCKVVGGAPDVCERG